MARKSPSRLELRKQAEAVEAAEEKKPKKSAKKAPTARAKRTKEKVPLRKRVVWVIYSGSMKEEGRFPYNELAAAEEKIEQLRQKSKKLYFLQPVKEILGEGGVVLPKPVSLDLDDEPAKPKKKVAKNSDDDDDDDRDSDDDDDDDE
jgi:hypothetical protein